MERMLKFLMKDPEVQRLLIRKIKEIGTEKI